MNCKNLITHMISITSETKTGGVNNGNNGK